MAAIAHHPAQPQSQPQHDILQPSAMPAPSPSKSNASYRITSRFGPGSTHPQAQPHPHPSGSGSASVKRPNIPEKEDVFYTPKEKDRAALVPINTNSNSQFKAEIGVGVGAGGRSISGAPTVYTTSIPRPAVAPDVFSYPTDNGHGHGNAIASGSTSHKRLNDENIYRGTGTGHGYGHEARPVKRRALDPADGNTAVRAKEVKAAREAREAEHEKWRTKWMKSFPTLTFHFEVEASEGAGKALKARAIKMGAKAEQFFSAKVTHLIVKTIPSPTKAKPGLSRGFGLKGSPKNPFYDSSAGSSLAQKAESLGIKVWTLKKLSDILDRLAPVGQAAIHNNSLSTLLQDEKLHGTRERDANAPRPDWYYFRPGSKYLLVEDATAKHRTILVKEYQQSTKALPEFPVLHDSFLRISSSCDTDIPTHQLRERAVSLYVHQEAWNGEQPPAAFKRSHSLRNVAHEATPIAPDVQPYHQASGNSVVLTSNIASTSTANYSPAFGANGLPSLGANKDRAIVQMSKRVQVLKGNAARAKFSPSIPPLASSISRLDSAGHSRRMSLGSNVMAPKERVFMTHEQVLLMLQKQRAPHVEEEVVSVDRRIRNREKVEMGTRGIKEQDTSSGYCENCRLRYDDLSVHLESKKHRRFAENPANFSELDSLLKLLRRQLNPNFAHDEVPFAPCWQDHTKDEYCSRCVYTVDPPGEGTPGASDAGHEEWVVEDQQEVSVSSQEAREEEEEEEEEGGFFEESAEDKEFD